MNDTDAKTSTFVRDAFISRRSLLVLLNWFGCIIIFVLSIWLYAGTLWGARSYEELIVDERHLLDGSNDDVTGTSSLVTLWNNDYWGRNIHRHDSHKSWRPLTVLTFRYFAPPKTEGVWKGAFQVPGMSAITWHRLVNVLIHAVAAQFIGIIARRLMLAQAHRSSSSSFEMVCAQWITVLIFSWHPTHVEVVANAANRPHVLAVLASAMVILLGTQSTSAFNHILFLGSGLVLALGLLCSETMVFQLPAILVTSTVIRWKRLRQQQFELVKELDESDAANSRNDSNNSPCQISDFWRWLSLLVQNVGHLWLCWTGLVLFYLGYRYWSNTLTMPDDLLDRTEVPFHDLQGRTRMYSFAFVVAIHIGKAIGVDWIGPAHEYSYNCVPPIETIHDDRILIPFFMFLGILFVTAMLFLQQRRQQQQPASVEKEKLSPNIADFDDADALCLWIVSLSWFVSLFPISGLVRVGTFIADRIVMPASVGVSFGLARLFLWVWTKTPRPIPIRLALLAMTIWWWWGLGSAQILQRTQEWTRNDLLFMRTKETCPSSAKNLLQLSKLHSAPPGAHLGVQHDLDIALKLVKQSHAIDPNFCRVHYQFAHIYLQQPNYKKMEQHLAKALVCPITGGMAMNLWNQYWPAVAKQDPNALARRDAYLRKLAPSEHTTQQQKDKRVGSSPTAGGAHHDDKDL